MESFGLIIEMFALLMGLAVAEVLRGFANVLKIKSQQRAGVGLEDGVKHTRIGWLLPLLGLFVIIDQATFWLHLYAAQFAVKFNLGSITIVLMLIGGYYLLSTLVFPDEPEEWNDLDDWFWLQRRRVMGGIIVLNMISLVLLAASGATQAAGVEQAKAVAVAPLRFGLSALLQISVIPFMFAVLWVKGPKKMTAMLGYIVLVTIVAGLMIIDLELGV